MGTNPGSYARATDQPHNTSEGFDNLSLVGTEPLNLLLETFVGRQNELNRLRRLVDETKEGGGGLVIISGEPGIGKTRLLTEAATYAEGKGVIAAWGRCWDGDGAPAFWPWDQILRKTLDDEQIAPTLRTEVAQLLSRDNKEHNHQSTEESQAERFRAFRSVAALLNTIGSANPRLVIVDDLHWADGASLQLLDFLTRGTTIPNVLLIATVRDQEVPPESQQEAVLSNALRNPVACRVHLAGLTADEAIGLIPHEYIARTRLADRLISLTAGNPLLMTELIRSLAFEGMNHRFGLNFESLPPTLRGAIDARLRSLPNSAISTLRFAAVCNGSFSSTLLAEIGAGETSQVEDDIRIAIHAALITCSPSQEGHYSFRHSLIREVLYRQLSQSDRSALHRALATALEAKHQAGEDDLAPAIAQHYFAALDEGGSEKAIYYNKLAVEHSLARLGFETAVLHCENLVRLTVGRPEMQCGALLQLGEAQLRSGRWSDARRSYASAARLAKQRNDWAALAKASIAFKGTRGSTIPPDQEALLLLREALEGPQPTETEATLLSHLAMALYSVSERERDTVSKLAVSRAEQCSNPETRALATIARAHSLSAPATYEKVWDLTQSFHKLQKGPANTSLAFRAHLMGYMCRLVQFDARADFELARCSQIADEVAHPTYLWQVSSLRAGRAIASGQIELAKSLTQNTRALGQQVHDLTAEQYFAGHQFWVSLLSGNAGDARPMIESLLQEAPETHVLRAGLAYLYAESGRQEEGAAIVDGYTKDDLARIPNDVFTLFTLGVLSEATAFVGNVAAAERIREHLYSYRGLNVVLSWGALIAGSTSYFLGLLETILGNLVGAEELFAEAIEGEARLGMTALVARTKLALAGAVSRNGASREAAKLMTESLETFKQLQLSPPKGLLALLDHPQQGETKARKSAAAAEPHKLTRTGDYWSVTFNNKTVQIKHSRGLEHLGLLIRHQDQEIPAIIISQGAEAPPTPTPETHAMQTYPQSQSSTDTPIDREALKQYRERRAHLKEEAEAAASRNDLGAIEKIQTEIEWIEAQVGEAYRTRRHGQIDRTSERARISVRNNLASAMKRLHRIHPELARHLEGAIRTGRLCVYRPENPMRWDVEDGH